jgi:uncharacterized SAM-binding protein YcdF (DUF218 family)
MMVNPFFICMLLFFILLCRSRPKKNGFIFVFLLFFFFSTGWFVKTITYHLENQYPIVTSVDPTIHWIVVLAGGQSQLTERPPNSMLYSASVKRLIEGVRLYRQLPNAKLLLSGGGYDSEISEATRLSQVALWFGLSNKDLVLETSSVNTAAQATALKEILRDKPFYLVTSASHMPRAMALCHAQNLHPIAAPTDFTLYWDDNGWEKTYLPNAYNLYYLSIAMHEILGSIVGGRK